MLTISPSRANRGSGLDEDSADRITYGALGKGKDDVV